MKCIKCYREIDDGLKFCPKCGFMQPIDRAAYEREHPELAVAKPNDEMPDVVSKLNNQPSDVGYIVPPLPPELPPELPSEPAAVDEAYRLDKSDSVVPKLSTPKEKPLTPPIFVAPSQEKTEECPICHQPIAFGSRQCPYCKQLLDWSYYSPANEKKATKKPKRWPLWILLAVVIALLACGAGYYISSSLRSKTHISKYDDIPDEPTGNPRKDAKQAVNEMLEIAENTSIVTEEDYLQFQKDIQNLIEKYEGYYMDISYDNLQEFKDEIDNYLIDNPDINKRLIEEADRIKMERAEINN